jgi:hypothetical protein
MMTPDRLAAVVADLALVDETDLRALLAASVHELARRRGFIRTACDLRDLSRHVATQSPTIPVTERTDQ